MGLTGSPPVFQSLMEKVLVGLTSQSKIPYLDDCIIFSRTAEEHNATLWEVFQRFKYAKLKINPLKCEFFRQHVPFLGHIVSRDGIQANPAKTSALRQYPVPKSVTEVKSFCWVSVPTTDGTFAISPQLLDLFFSLQKKRKKSTGTAKPKWPLNN